MILKCDKKKKQYISIFILAFITAIADVLFVTDSRMGVIVAMVQTLILVADVFMRKYALFTAHYVVFVSLCMEFGEFVGEAGAIYNIKEIRFLGINLGVWVSMPMIILAVFNVLAGKRLNGGNREFSRVAKFLLVMNVMAAAVGILCIMVNDNNITNMSGYFGSYVDEVYAYMFLPIAFISMFYLIINFDSENMYLIPYALQATLIGVTVEVVVSLLTGISGAYGSTDTLLCSVVSVFLPIGILSAVNLKNRVPFSRLSAIVCLIGTLLCVRYNSSGKLILLAAIVLVYFLYSCIRYGTGIRKAIAIGLSIVVIISVPYILLSFMKDNDLFAWKLYQVKCLLSFGDGWIENLPFSPKVRIGELGNVMIELINKPWMALTGKGFLGSVPNHLEWWDNGALIELNGRGAYTLPELYNNSFYALHEVSAYLLIYGGCGVAFAGFVIRRLVKSIRKNVWAIHGLMWFVLFYGYSFTIGTFGICCFLFSFIQTGDFKLIRNPTN